mgnify:CR=1 FL=1
MDNYILEIPDTAGYTIREIQHIMSFPDEYTAFKAYSEIYPNACILLVDTYDTLSARPNLLIQATESPPPISE